MPEQQLQIELARESLLALAERALFWPRMKTLFVADVHFGKDATFRKAMRWVPPGTTTDDLRRLSDLVSGHKAKQLIVLGDTFHSEHAREDETFEQLRNWRKSVRANVLLVKGNHDREAIELAQEAGFDWLEEDHSLPPFTLRHCPCEKPPDGYALCGHLHPEVIARGLARQSLRIRCFWIRSHECVLPAFGGFTGGYVVQPTTRDRVLLVAGDSILEASTARRK